MGDGLSAMECQVVIIRPSSRLLPEAAPRLLLICGRPCLLSVPFSLVRCEGRGLRGGSGGGFTYSVSEEAPLKGLIKFTRPPTEQRRRNRSENICT